MERDLTELNKLEAYLKKNNIIYIREDEEPFPLLDRHRIVVYEKGTRRWEAKCQAGSFGGRDGLIEISGELVEAGYALKGFLKADDVIERIERYGHGKT